MVALFSLLGVIAVSLVITRVATVVLTATGLSREEARFQARSALTGTGFTTSEAEAVVNHPIRRRVVMFLMLLGNAGVVAAASTLIIGFRPGGTRDYWLVIQLFGGLILLVMFSRSRWVDQRLTKLIARALERWTDLPTRAEATLLALRATGPSPSCVCGRPTGSMGRPSASSRGTALRSASSGSPGDAVTTRGVRRRRRGSRRATS